MAGRPKMTEEQKAAAKADREAKKAAAAAGAPAAADRAEARSNGAKPAAAAKASAPAANSDDLDREEKALFLHHMPLIKAAKEALNTANGNLRNLYKKAKAEGGFTKADFDTAFAIETAEKEARERAKIARQMRIAQIVGSSLGNQLDLFLEPDRTPSVDIARGEGERDALQGLAAKPKYDPSTEQARAYLEGWHHANAGTVKDGIKKLDPEIEKHAEQQAKDKAKIDQQRAVDAKAFEGKPAEVKDQEIPQADQPATPAPPPPNPAPSSGTPLTRAQFRAQQEQARQAAAAAK